MNKPSFWPENPYPESVWPMTMDDVSYEIRDPDMLTAISGSMGRHFYNLALEDVWELVAPELAENEDLKKIIEKCYEFFAAFPRRERDEETHTRIQDAVEDLFLVCRAALGIGDAEAE